MTFFAPVRRLTAGQKRGEGSGFRSLFLVALVLATLACEKEARVVVAAAGTPEQGVQSPANAVAGKPTGQRFPTLNDDAKFEELVKDNRDRISFKAGFKMDERFAQKYSPSYSKELCEHAWLLAERQDRIEQQLAKYSDPQLKAVAKAKVEGTERTLLEPIPSKHQEQEAIMAFERVKDDYVRSHANDFFVLGTYDDYYTEGEFAQINLTKIQTVIAGDSPRSKDYSAALKKIGKPVDLTLCKGPMVYEAGEIAPGYPWDGVDLSKAFSLMERVAKYGQASLTADEVWGLQWEVAKVILVAISVDEMNQAFSAVDSTWKTTFEELYNKEYQKGGYWLDIEGKKFWHDYSDPGENKMLRKRVRSIVRKQAIFLVGKGDPFDLKLTECGLMVSGTNQYVKKLF